MNKIFYCCLFLLHTAIVHGQPPNVRDVTEFRIDPQYARTGAASLFFKEVQFIPLQSGEASFVGKINRLEVHQDHFIIHDRESDAISIFKKDGSFVNKITSIPGIKRERMRLEWFYNFAIDRETNTIVVQSRLAYGKLFVFDLKGKYLNKTYSVPVNTGDFTMVGNNRIATRPMRPHRYYTRDGKEQVPYAGFDAYSLFITARDSTVLQKLLPIDLQKAPTEDEKLGTYIPFNYSGVPGEAYYRRFFDYHFYQVSANGIGKVYSVVFPAYKSLPPNFFADSVGKRHLWMKSSRLILALNNIYRANHIFSFSWLVLGGVLEAKSDILYNSKTGNSVYLGGVTPDSLTQFLPPFNPSDDILACDGVSFYGAVSSYQLHAAKDGMKTPAFNKVMDAYFKNTTSQSNPVIVQWIPRDAF